MMLAVFSDACQADAFGCSPESRVGRCELRGSVYDAHLLRELVEIPSLLCCPLENLPQGPLRSRLDQKRTECSERERNGQRVLS